MTAPRPKQLVIVGGGVAGLELATALGQSRYRAELAVTLIDRDSAHIWKPMLHTIAAGTRDITQQQVSYLAQARRAHFQYQLGELCALDRRARKICLADIRAPEGDLLVPKRELHYDALVLAVGSTANDFGIPGVAEHCHMIDSRRQADAFNREVRQRMLESLGRKRDLAIAIVGGGATGVELAAELVQLTEEITAYGAKDLACHVQITLIEAGDRILAAFPEAVSRAAQKRLESLGVRVRLNAQVKSAQADCLELDDNERVEATLSVWAAGIKAPDVFADLDGLEANRNNTLVVTAHLQSSRDPCIYAMGDCASLTPPGDEQPLPPTAQVAHQQAKYLSRHLPALLKGNPAPDFKYRHFGALVSLGKYDAYGSLGKLGLLEGSLIQGRAARLSHALLYRAHQTRIHGFWRGGLLWLVDALSDRVRPSVRMD